MLRVSDGFWDTEIVMKVIETGTSNFSNLSNKVITGRTSGATARVTTVTKFTAVSYTHLTLPTTIEV